MLRSAATHYKLLDNDVLMLKDKEVISDPVRQMAVARKLHEEGGHAGINKTTSVIAEKYHWSRIKETVSDVIKTCEECKDLGKSPPVQSQNQSQNQNQSDNQPVTQAQTLGRVPPPFGTRDVPDSAADLMTPQPPPLHEHHGVEAASRILDLHHSIHDAPSHHMASHLVTNPGPYAHPSDIASLLNPPFQTPSSPALHAPAHHLMLHGEPHHASAAATLASLHDAELYQPIDPQIISQSMHSSHPSHQHHHHHHHHHQHHPPDAFSSFHTRIPVSHHHQHPASPHLRHSPLSAHDLEYSPHVSHHGHGHSHDDGESFQALLNDPDPDTDTMSTPHHHHHHHHHSPIHRDHDQDAVDRDMAMLIEHDDDSPSPPPSHRAPSPSDMDIDDLGLGPVPDGSPPPPLHKGDADDGRAGKGRRSAVADDGGPAAALGTKRSDIYDVVFHSS